MNIITTISALELDDLFNDLPVVMNTEKMTDSLLYLNKYQHPWKKKIKPPHINESIIRYQRKHYPTYFFFSSNTTIYKGNANVGIDVFFIFILSSIC